MKGYGKAVVVRVAVIVVSFAAAAVAVVLLSNDLKAKSAFIAQMRSANERVSLSSETLARLKADQATAAKMLGTLNGFLPNQYELFGFTGWAERAGRRLGITVTANIQVGSLYLLSDPIGYAPIGLTAVGSRPAVFSYLKFIEGNNRQYLIAIDTANFSQRPGSTSTVVSAAGKLFFTRQ